MDLLLKAVDSLTFGDGKPFNSGENTFRSSFNEVLNVNIYSAIKKAINSDIHINFISLINEENILMIPFPKDIGYNVSKIKFNQKNKFILVPLSKDKDKGTDYKYLRQESFFRYLELKDAFWKKQIRSLKKELKDNVPANVITVNEKIGIQIDRKTKNTKESQFYIQKFLNLKDINIYVKLNSKENINNNLYKEAILLGGESKLANIKKTSNILSVFGDDLKNRIKNKIKETKYFKIVLLTPTNYPPKIEGAKLIAQITGKLITFSGWFNIYDNSSKKLDRFPSRLFKLIPAGAVFYYKLEDEGDLEEIFNNFWLKPAFFVKEYPYFEKLEDGTNPLGFGLSIIGVANIEEN